MNSVREVEEATFQELYVDKCVDTGGAIRPGRVRWTSERWRWLDDLREWGYPIAEEYANVVLMEVGDRDAWIWFEVIEGGAALVHLCARPSRRGKWFTRHVRDGIRWSAELLGLTRVYFIDNGYNEKVADYVERLGWVKFKNGYYLEV